MQSSNPARSTNQHNEEETMSDTQRRSTDIQRANPEYVGSWLGRNAKTIGKALPPEMSMTLNGLFRLYMAVLELSERAEDLQRCTADSVVSTVIQGISLGLAPGPMQQAFLVPYGGICTLQVGYRGLTTLAHRTDKVKTLYSECRYENDEFYQERGTAPRIHHVPADGPRGDLVGAYAVYLGKGGEVDFEYMDLDALNAIKANAHGTHKSSSPYVKWESEMRRKAPLKRLCKRLDLSPRLMQAVHLDNQSETRSKQDRPAWIDVSASVSDAETVAPSQDVISAPEPSNPPDAPEPGPTTERPAPAASKSERQTLIDSIHAIGRKLYPGDGEWDAQRKRDCNWCSDAKTNSIRDLDLTQLQHLRADIESRERAHAAGRSISTPEGGV